MEHTLTGHERSSSVAISLNGALLATTDETKVLLWRTSNGNLVATYDESQRGAHEVEFVDDETILHAAYGNRLRSRNLTTGEVLYDPTTQPKGPVAPAYSPTTEHVALGGHFGRVELRNARTGDLVQTLVRDPLFVAAEVAVSPDGRRLVIGGSRRTAHVRDAQTGSLIATFVTPLSVLPVPPSMDEIPPEHAIFDAAFAPDSKYVYGACHDGRLRKWDAETGSELASFQVSED